MCVHSVYAHVAGSVHAMCPTLFAFRVLHSCLNLAGQGCNAHCVLPCCTAYCHACYMCMFVSCSYVPPMQLLSPSTGFATMGACLVLVVQGVWQGFRPPVLQLGYLAYALVLAGVLLHCCGHVGCKVSCSGGFCTCGYGDEACD